MKYNFIQSTRKEEAIRLTSMTSYIFCIKWLINGRNPLHQSELIYIYLECFHFECFKCTESRWRGRLFNVNEPEKERLELEVSIFTWLKVIYFHECEDIQSESCDLSGIVELWSFIVNNLFFFFFSIKTHFLNSSCLSNGSNLRVRHLCA